jgi:tetratricopeptide (TPR) repeat protein
LEKIVNNLGEYLMEYLIHRLSFLFVLIIFLFINITVLANEGNVTKVNFSEEELKVVYNSLKQEDKDAMKTWSEEDIINYLRSRAMYEREKNAPYNGPEIPEHSNANKNIEIYEPDPLLKKAFEAYSDPNVPSNNAIQLFEKYIEKNPDSPFLAEIYFRIGALYSIHIRKNLGEQKNMDLQKKYYEKAHKLYGDKFSYLNDTAWASLVNMTSSSLEERKKYYDWLLKFKKEIKPDDIYPIREIEQTFNGRQPKLSSREITTISKGLKANLAHFIDSTEKNILWRTGGNYKDLADLASSYPDTNLGKNAKIRLKPIDKLYLDLLDTGKPSSSIAGMNKDLLEPNVSSEPFTEDIKNIQKGKDVTEKGIIPHTTLGNVEHHFIRNLTIGIIAMVVLSTGILLIIKKL